jgi:hypothetical protein
MEKRRFAALALPELSDDLSILRFGPSVTTMSKPFQPGAIANRYHSALRAYQTLFLQGMEGIRNRRPSDSQNGCQEFVRERYPVTVQAVVAHQYPPRQTLLRGMVRIGKRRIGGLDEKRLDVFVQQPAKIRYTLDHSPQRLDLYAQASPTNLHEDVECRRMPV